MPMTWRKWLLDLTRIQADPTVNSTLTSSFSMLQPAEVIVNNPTEALHVLHKGTMLEYSSTLYDSSIACSILSYFVRAETTAFVDEFLEVLEETITKETKAALFYLPHESKLDYSSLFGDESRSLSLYTSSERQRRVVHLLRQNLNAFKAIHTSSTAPCLIPIYNRKKNIAMSSQEELHRSLYGEACTELEQRRDYTTLDLLQHYHETGNRIGGPLEVRCTWKYGDLKPRVYYCNGGDSYWPSTFIKPIVNHILRALPSTNPDTRYSVERLGTIGSDELLVTYDYTSFTTSLSELKFFLHHLADSLVGTTVRCLDVRHGVVDIDAGLYLHDYNRIVNIHQEIDLRRFVRGDHRTTIFHQGRNGSLGVQGNIGFSMSLHGISLGSFTSKPDDESDVGDDALTVLFKDLLPLFILHTNLLGDIHPEKFSTFNRPPDDDPMMSVVQSFKYLKRPISVDYTGRIRQGVLEFFPSIADYLFPDGDGIHQSVMNNDPVSMVRSLVMQWGRFLSLHLHSESLDRTFDGDLELILDSVGLCYDMVGLPKDGGIPGTVFYPLGPNESSVEAEFFIPACDSVTVFTVDWVEALYATHSGAVLHSPVTVGGTQCMDPHAQLGARMRVSSGDRLFPLLYDLGYITRESIVEELTFDNSYVKRLRKMMAGETGEQLFEVVVVRDLPDWYFPLASESFYELEVVNVIGKLEEIQSVTSISIR